MVLGLPLELITMLGSGLMGAVMSIWSQAIKAKNEASNRAIAALAAQNKSYDAARSWDKPIVQFTRRIIALSAVFSIIVFPKLAAVFWPEVPVYVGYTEFDPGFLFFSGSESVKWVQAHGLVITPLDTHLMSSITGLYFGASIARNA